MYVKYSGESANYDFSDKGDKKKPRMGDGDFAGMPSKMKMEYWPTPQDFRSGLPTKSQKCISKLSDIDENGSGVK